ncbi:TetR family transcriptional regulator [Streptomyces sp. 846.5]|nr:TetR family transcriptional regulator [Streptomyces sp. 846.5]
MQERALRTRMFLVERAAEVFARRGYRGASLDEIATAAGVSTGALHFHFPTKVQLSDAVRAAGQPALRLLVQSLDTRRPAPVQQLINLSQLVLEWLAGDVKVRIAVRMHHELPPAPESGPDFCTDWLYEMRVLTALAARRGNLLPGLDLPEVDATIAAATAGAELLAGRQGRCRGVSEVAATWRLILPGLVGEAAARGLDPYGGLHLGNRSRLPQISRTAPPTAPRLPVRVPVPRR